MTIFINRNDYHITNNLNVQSGVSLREITCNVCAGLKFFLCGRLHIRNSAIFSKVILVIRPNFHISISGRGPSEKKCHVKTVS